MKTAKQYYTKDNPPPSISIFNLVKNILKDSDISVHASNILAQLVLASGYKGYCWMLIDTISKNSRLGRTQTKLYLKELVTKKRIKIHHRPGRSSNFEVLDITKESNLVSRSTDHIKEYKNKENVIGRTNVVLNFSEKTKPATHSDCGPTDQFIETKPPSTLANNNNKIIIKNSIQPSNIEVQKPIKTYSNVVDMTLVQEILQITNDKKSLNCFIKIVKNCPEDIIFAALSSLKIAMEENYILRPGAYFVSTIKSYYPDIFNSQKNAPVTPPTKNNSSVVPLGTSKEQYLEPEDNIIPASPEIVKEAISAIKSILDKPRCNMLMPGGKKSGKVIIQNH